MNGLALILGYWIMFLSGLVTLAVLSGFTLFAVTRIMERISRIYRGSKHETRN